MNARIFKAASVVAAALLLIFGQALAGDRKVDCDDGDSLQKAIDSGTGSAAPVDIYVTGTCMEDVLIRRDKVSILGDGNTLIDGQITVRGADNLTIRDLTITGPGHGINASVARIFMVNVNLVGNDDYGLALRHGGAIFMRNGLIGYNKGDIGLLIENGLGSLRNMEIFQNAADGIVVNENGSLTMIGGSVSFHDNGTGIIVNLSSALELVGATVANNQAHGIFLSLGSVAAINDSHVEDNIEIGIVLEGNSTLQMLGGGISRNGLYGAYEMAHSVLTLDGVRVDNNAAHGVVVETDSALIAGGGSRIEYNKAGDGVQIECRDKESSVRIDGPVVDGPADINCPDQDF